MTKATLATIVGLQVSVQHLDADGRSTSYTLGILVDLNSVGITVKNQVERLVFIPMTRVVSIYEIS